MKTAERDGKMILVGKTRVKHIDADGKITETAFPTAILGDVDRFGFVMRNGKSPNVVFENGYFKAALSINKGNSVLSLKIEAESKEEAIALWNSLVIADAL